MEDHTEQPKSDEHREEDAIKEQSSWKSGLNRRSLMKKLGVMGSAGLLGTTSVGSGLASATSKQPKTARNDPLDSELTVINGYAVVSKSLSSGSAPSIPTSPVKLDPDTKITPQTLAAFLNNGVQKGYWTLSEKQGRVMVSPSVSPSNVSATSTSSNSSPSGVTALSTNCGVTQLTWSIQLTYASITLWMDEQLTNDVAAALLVGGGTSEAIGLILDATGIGAVPGVISQLLGIVLGVFAGVIEIYDEGCGVKITATKYYLGGTTENIQAQ